MLSLRAKIATGSVLVFTAACAAQTQGAAAPQLAQARNAAPEGAQVYEQSCAGCHAKNGSGDAGPGLMGPNALGDYATAAELHAFVHEEMPEDDPGSLGDAQYWSVVEYVVRANGVSVPESGLSADNAASVKLH